MNENTYPVQSIKTLIKASILAVVVAAILFVTVVLPAEFGIDPTGSGKLLGLTVLAKNDVSEDSPSTESIYQYQENAVTVIVPANRGVEYKFKLEQYANLKYEWSSDGTPLHFDFHGEPQGDTTGYFESYIIATSTEMKGSMTMPFIGAHGWYWENATDKDVAVILKTKGHYQIIGNPKL